MIPTWMNQPGQRSPYSSYELALDFKNGIYRSGSVVSRSSPAALPGYSFAQTGDCWEFGLDGKPIFSPSGSPSIVPGIGYWARGAVTNLLLRSGPTTTQYPVRGQTADAAAPVGDPFGLSWVTVGNVATAGFAYQSATVAASTQYCISCLVESPDGSPPVAGTNTGSGDFCLLGGGGTIATPLSTVRIPGTNIWRVSGIFTSAATPSTNNGVVHYTTQAERNLKFSGWQLVQGDQPGPMIITTGAQATVSAADMRFSQPIPQDEDWLITVAWSPQGAPDTNRVGLTLSDGTNTNRVVPYRSSTGQLLSLFTPGGGSRDSGIIQSTAGRIVQAAARQGGKNVGGAKNSSLSTGISSNSGTVAYPLGLNQWRVGGSLQPTEVSNAPIEFIGFRKGTFSDADIASILQSA